MQESCGVAEQREGRIYLVAGNGRRWRRLQAAEKGESRRGESNLGDGGEIPTTEAQFQATAEREIDSTQQRRRSIQFLPTEGIDRERARGGWG